MNLWSVEHFLTIFVITFGWVCCCFAVAPTQKWWQKWPRNVQLIWSSFGKEIHTTYKSRSLICFWDFLTFTVYHPENMTDHATFLAKEMERNFAGTTWVVFVAKEDSDSGSYCAPINNSLVMAHYEGVVYTIFQVRWPILTFIIFIHLHFIRRQSKFETRINIFR